MNPGAMFRPTQEARAIASSAVVPTRIPEPRQVEDSLRTLSRAIEQCPVSIVITDPKGNIQYVNPKFEQLTGYTSAEAIGLNPSILSSGEKPAEEYRELWTTITSGKTWQGEFHNRRKDGTLFWEHASISPILDEQGNLVHFVAVKEDITERKLVEATLRASEARYRAVTQSANDAIITADSAGNIVGWNRCAETIFGYKETEVNGRSLTMLMPARYRDRHLAGLNRANSGAAPQVIGKALELEGLRKDGSEFPMELSLAQWEVDEGHFFTGTVRDITERKRAETSLHIAAIAFESQEGMIVTNAENVILHVNRAFTEISGYSAEEAVGRTPRLLSSGHHDDAFYAAMWETIRHTGSWQGEIWNRRKNGEVYPEWLIITAVKAEEGTITHYVGALTDITLRKAAAEEIEHLAFYDSLTNLPNRRLLLDRLQQALAASARSMRQGALFFIDLDNFKMLNDTLGHDKGDLLLKQVAQRLVTCVREEDTVARLGGDEFVVMLADLSESLDEAGAQTEAVGHKILDALNLPYSLAGHEHLSTPSIGVTLFRSPNKSVEELLKRADLAMYQSKAAGRNTLRFFDPEMQAAVTARASMEADLRQAVREKQFVLYYQAQMMGTGWLTGAEALVRWQHPRRGLVSPVDFIPLAEETGLILPLGQWVLETACTQLVAWAARTDTDYLTLAVNVSARQFRHPDFVGQVLAVLDRTGANPHLLKLELTESLLLENVEEVIAKMSVLKGRGIGFSLDDFGTGYSSLSYLKRLPLDQLKIDQSFVHDVFSDPNDAAIARTIVALAQSMGLSVIAEGVETEGQRDFLASQGCHACQGYLFSRPLPIDGFEEFAQLSKVANVEK